MLVNLVSVTTGEVLGAMKVDGDDTTFSDKTAQRIFNSLKNAYETPPSDAEILNIFADGWSNGYVKTIKA